MSVLQALFDKVKNEKQMEQQAKGLQEETTE